MEIKEEEEGPDYKHPRGPGGASGCLPDTKAIVRMMSTLEAVGPSRTVWTVAVDLLRPPPLMNRDPLCENLHPSLD